MEVHAKAKLHWEAYLTELPTPVPYEGHEGVSQASAPDFCVAPSEILDPELTAVMNSDKVSGASSPHVYGALDRVLDEYYQVDLTLSASACDNVTVEVL